MQHTPEEIEALNDAIKLIHDCRLSLTGRPWYSTWLKLYHAQCYLESQLVNRATKGE